MITVERDSDIGKKLNIEEYRNNYWKVIPFSFNNMKVVRIFISEKRSRPQWIWCTNSYRSFAGWSEYIYEGTSEYEYLLRNIRIIKCLS